MSQNYWTTAGQGDNQIVGENTSRRTIFLLCDVIAPLMYGDGDAKSFIRHLGYAFKTPNRRRVVAGWTGLEPLPRLDWRWQLLLRDLPL